MVELLTVGATVVLSGIIDGALEFVEIDGALEFVEIDGALELVVLDTIVGTVVAASPTASLPTLRIIEFRVPT